MTPTSQGERVLLQALVEARAAVQRSVRDLEAQITHSGDEQYLDVLRQHLDAARVHGTQIGQRVAELGYGAGIGLLMVDPPPSTGDVDRPLARVRPDAPTADQMVHAAREVYVVDAHEIATYAAIESMATAVNDQETARLAAELQAEQRELAAAALEEVQSLVLDAAGLPRQDSVADEHQQGDDAEQEQRRVDERAGGDRDDQQHHGEDHQHGGLRVPGPLPAESPGSAETGR